MLLMRKNRVPKVTITFNLPDEEYAYKQHVKAADMAHVIWEFTQFVREKVKYGDSTVTASWRDVSDIWWDFLNDSKVDPHEE